MQSKATTVASYLAQLPPDRRAALSAVRKVILANVDESIEEGMQYGMIGYYVPHRVYPAGYHCDPRQPLPFAGLASQKNYMSLYLMSCYVEEGADAAWLRHAWAKTGKKLDMGKCCLRFKKVDDLALDLIGEALRRMPAKKYIALYESAIRPPGQTKARKAGASSSPTRRAAAKKRPTRKTASVD